MIQDAYELAAALAAIEEAEEAVRQAVRYAKQMLGSHEEERAMRVVRKCQAERDSANQRFLGVRTRATSLGPLSLAPLPLRS